MGLTLMSVLLSFNPRTREGCDLSFSSYINDNICFNPRTREGCDIDAIDPDFIHIEFQSTHPRGVRLLVRPFNDILP